MSVVRPFLEHLLTSSQQRWTGKLACCASVCVCTHDNAHGFSGSGKTPRTFFSHHISLFFSAMRASCLHQSSSSGSWSLWLSVLHFFRLSSVIIQIYLPVFMPLLQTHLSSSVLFCLPLLVCFVPHLLSAIFSFFPVFPLAFSAQVLQFWFKALPELESNIWKKYDLTMSHCERRNRISSVFFESVT